MAFTKTLQPLPIIDRMQSAPRQPSTTLPGILVLLALAGAAQARQPTAPELSATRYGEEMWELFAKGELHADTVLTGEFADDQTPVDVEGVRQVIDDARAENERRQQGREVAAGKREQKLIEDDLNPEFTAG